MIDQDGFRLNVGSFSRIRPAPFFGLGDEVKIPGSFHKEE